jgi:hypothetical protein
MTETIGHLNTEGVKAGDVLAIHTDGAGAELIRIGASLIDEACAANHIAVLDHQDAKGTWWCIEGRPGGVGWQDATGYLGSVYTVTNRNQPKTDAQRAQVCATMKSLLGVGYDWDAIFDDGLRDLHIPDPWSETWRGEVAGHVVCSSAAVIGYARAVLGYPKNVAQPLVQPADWIKFITDNQFQ